MRFTPKHIGVQKQRDIIHIYFLDIDEFWTPRDFNSGIHSCLSKFPNISSISFNWLNIINEEVEFSDLLQEHYVQPAPTVKSVINLNANISKIQPHLPEFLLDSQFKGHKLSDGRDFKHSQVERQRLADSEKNTAYPYVILHRMFRSQMEYVSLLYRGNPRGSTPFKMNRPGYLKSAPNIKKWMVPQNLFQSYAFKYDKFLAELELNEELILARKAIYDRYNDAVFTLEKGPKNFRIEDITGIKRIFSGLEDVRIINALGKFNEEKSISISNLKRWIQKLMRY